MSANFLRVPIPGRDFGVSIDSSLDRVFRSTDRDSVSRCTGFFGSLLGGEGGWTLLLSVKVPVSSPGTSTTGMLDVKGDDGKDRPQEVIRRSET